MGLGTQEKLRELDLLERFTPTLHFDALERWRPGPADDYLRLSTFVEESDVVVSGSPPAQAAIAAHHDELESRLNPLAEDLDYRTQQRSGAMLRRYGRGQNLSEAGSCYGRVIQKSGDTLFLQYWLFYADNPCVLPPGRHDGDWELVQICVQSSGSNTVATHVTVAGHGKPVTRKLKPGEDRPNVYVAVDSHASYLEPGAHPILPLSDVCDPDGEGSVPNVEPLPADGPMPAWISWHGRWGMNRGAGTWFALWVRLKRTPAFLRGLKVGAGESPPSPGRQGQSWDSPAAFQLRGGGRRQVISRGQRLAHLVGRLTWPRLLPAVRVENVAPGSFTIRAKPVGHFLRRVSFVSVAFEEIGEKDVRVPLATYSARCGHPAGPFEIRHKGEIRWRAAGYNALRQRGEPGPMQKPAQPPWPLKLCGGSDDDQGARRVFAGALTNHLRRRGATSTDDLAGKLGWFWLRLSQEEIKEVVDASRRDGYVEPLGQDRDGGGGPVTADEWTLTDRGRKLERTRALSLRDSIVAVRGIGKPVVSATEKWTKRVAAALTAIVPTLALSLETSISIGVITLGVILALVARSSLRGETELRRAAEHWPRLRVCRPRVYAWQTAAWRPWERVPIAAAVALYLVGSSVALQVTDTWEFNIPIALAIGIALTALAWWRLRRPWRRWYALNKAFRRERNRIRNLRRKHPDHTCHWGHVCEAAQWGPSVRCPKFGPGAAEEADRVPPAI